MGGLRPTTEQPERPKGAEVAIFDAEDRYTNSRLESGDDERAE